jgi:hypothetical protein
MSKAYRSAQAHWQKYGYPEGTQPGALKAAGEANDCAVRALSAAAAVSYDEAHRATEAAGRRPRRGTPIEVTRQAARLLGMRVRHFRAQGNEHRAAELVKPQGRYIVRVTRHVYAIVNGVSFDSAPGRRARQLISVTELTGTPSPFVPAPAKPKPTTDEKRSAELQRTQAAIKRWTTKAKRAATALRKLAAKQRRLAKLLSVEV